MHHLLLCPLSLLKKTLKTTGDKNSVSSFSLTTPTCHKVLIPSLEHNCGLEHFPIQEVLFCSVLG